MFILVSVTKLKLLQKFTAQVHKSQAMWVISMELFFHLEF